MKQQLVHDERKFIKHFEQRCRDMYIRAENWSITATYPDWVGALLCLAQLGLLNYV